MQKFFVEENQIENDKIVIIGEDVKHISSVLRMQKGEQILIGSRETLETYLTEIKQIEKPKDNIYVYPPDDTYVPTSAMS